MLDLLVTVGADVPASPRGTISTILCFPPRAHNCKNPGGGNKAWFCVAFLARPQGLAHSWVPNNIWGRKIDAYKMLKTREGSKRGAEGKKQRTTPGNTNSYQHGRYQSNVSLTLRM